MAALEAARTEPLRLVVSAPPRHGKTETLLHALAWWLAHDPQLTMAYVSYASEFARSKSRKARSLALAAGAVLAADAARLEEWRTVQGGGVLATGIGGPLTGQGVHRLVVDDPVKNRVEAESALMRERHWEWFNDVAFTRLEPGGSAVVVMARWHPDDLAGRLLAQGWQSLSLPALNADGKALWPERWPAVDLAEVRKQVGEYSWASLYQGEPRPRGGALFGDAYLYDEPPADGYRIAIGLDLAYTAKSHADYSVAVTLAERAGTYYVLDVLRMQVQAPEFAGRVKSMRAERYPTARTTAYVGGTEQGVVQFMGTQGLDIEAWPAKGDKFVRAQPVAAAWNAGKVMVPRTATWADAFVGEIVSFTGVSDEHDDQVDALAAAYTALSDQREFFVI